MRIRLLLGSVLVSVLLSGSPSLAVEAHATDQQPCVSTRESRSGAVVGKTRHEVESRWEVVGLGQLAVLPPIRWTIIFYPRCGHSDFVGAVYYKDSHRLNSVFYWEGPLP